MLSPIKKIKHVHTESDTVPRQHVLSEEMFNITLIKSLYN